VLELKVKVASILPVRSAHPTTETDGNRTAFILPADSGGPELLRARSQPMDEVTSVKTGDLFRRNAVACGKCLQFWRKPARGAKFDRM